MATIYSSDLKLSIMATGENAGTWGSITNTNLYLLQQAIGGYQEVNIAGGAQTTALTMSDGAISNARNAVIKLTGTITGNQVVTIPNSIEKTYTIENGTTGAFTVQFKTVSGTGPTFSTTDKGIKLLYSNGTDVIDVNADLSASTFASISSGQIDILAQAELRLQDTTGGQYVGFKAPGTVSSSYTLTLPTATGSAGQTMVTDGSGVLSFAAAGRTGAVDWDTTPKTTTVTAVSGVGYFVNTTSGAVTVNLPAGSAGSIVAISDYANTAATNNIIIDPNGTDKINGVNENAKITTNGVAVTLIYIDSTRGWKDINDATLNVTGTPPFVVATGGTITTCGNYKIHTFTGPGTFTVTDAGGPTGSNTVDYMVVAGGGGGGKGNSHGAGGGAGGFRESVPSPAAWTASPLANPGGALPVSATAYPITVGAGGAAQCSIAIGNSGNPSVFSTITSTGGGGGGHYPNNPGASGGSGGGGTGTTGVGGAGNTPPVSPPQGSTGGSSTSGSIMAGGGGATAVGGSVPGPAAGGAGATTSISASPTAYAGGGGGGAGTGSPSGAGGTGGGGAGSNTTAPGTAGTANRGGGGGGQGEPPGGGGAGGSGIVIIRYKFQ